MTILQVAITTFITAFLAFGLWGWIVGVGKKTKSTGQSQSQGKLIFRDILPCVDGEEYYAVEVREVAKDDYRLCVRFDGKALFEVPPLVLKSWADMIASMQGVDTNG